MKFLSAALFAVASLWALPAFGQVPTLLSVGSVQNQGGTFYSLPLSLTGTTNVECRQVSGSLQLVFTFDQTVSSGTAAILSGNGSVTGSPTFSGSTMTVNLTGVTDAQYMTVAVSNLNGSGKAADVIFGVLFGDVNGNGILTSADALIVRSQSLQPLTSANFRDDLNEDGIINVNDFNLFNGILGQHPLPTITAPTPVTSLTGTLSTANAGEIDLTWTNPTPNNASALVLSRSPDGGSSWMTIAVLASTASSYADTHLAAGSYEYQIGAQNAKGTAADSGSPVADPPLSAPTGLTENLNTSGTMTLSWTPVSGAISYTIDREIVSTGVWQSAFASSSSPTYPDIASSYGSGGFRYRVSATANGTTSGFSSVVPTPNFAVIDLGANQIPRLANNVGAIILSSSNGSQTLWQSGSTSNVTSVSISGINDSNMISSVVSTETLTPVPSGTPSDNGKFFTYNHPWSGQISTLSPLDYYSKLFPAPPPAFAFFTQDGAQAPTTWVTMNSMNNCVGIDNQGNVAAQYQQVYYTQNLSVRGVGTGYVTGSGSTVISSTFSYNSQTWMGPFTHNAALNTSGLSFTPSVVSLSGIILGNYTDYTNVISPNVYKTGPGYWDTTAVQKAPDGATLVSVNSLGEILGSTLTGSVSSVLTLRTAATSPLVGYWNKSHQVVGSYPGVGGNSLFYDPSAQNPGPASLNDLVGDSTGWTNLVSGGLQNALNDAGAIVGTATYSGTATTSGLHAIMLLPIQINHADGSKQDQPMAYLPQWTPNNGSGRGQPIYHTPTAVLQISSIGTTMATTFLGQSYTLTQNVSNPLLYLNTTSGLSILLSAAPLKDPSVQESLQAIVNLSSAGVSNAVYLCDETTASSNVFQDVTPGISIALSGLNPAIADTMTFQVTGDSFSNNVTLTETGPNTLIFTGSGITVQLVNNSAVGGTLYVALTYSAYNYSNTVMPVSFVSTAQYQNFAPPSPTDQPPESVDSFASFYIQVPIAITSGGGTPSVDLTIQVNGVDTDIGTVDLASAPNNSWRSVKKLVLLSPGADASQMTGADTSNFQALQLPMGAKMDWTQGGGVINAKYGGGNLPIKAQANGVALESLGFTTWLGQGIDVENRIRLPFVSMGYAMDSDYNATTPKSLSTYITGGKQIWYSMSHGDTYVSPGSPLNGTSNAPFDGLTFKDANSQGLISARVLPAGLNYRLVICDGCCSAQTSLASQTASQANNNLLSNCSGFADKFGPKVAYVGWSWEVAPTLQQFIGEFVGDLQGKGVTVQSAYLKFLQNHVSGSEAYELKIYGNTGVSVDIPSNP